MTSTSHGVHYGLLKMVRCLTAVCIAIAALTVNGTSLAAQDLFSLFSVKSNPDGSTDYRDREFAVSFRLPNHCYVDQASRWMDAGWEEAKGPGEPATTVEITGKQIDLKLYYRLFLKPMPKTAAEKDQLLISYVDNKVSQRRNQKGWKDYRVRRDSYQRREIGGQRALSYVASFTEGKKEMAEYLVTVQSERCFAQFFITTRADQLDEVRQKVEPIVQSLRLP